MPALTSLALGASAIGSVAGSAMGASAAGDAADKQSAAAREANDLQWKMFQQQRGDQDPYRQAGMNALYGTGGIFRRKDGGSGVAMKAFDPAAKDKFIQAQMAQAQSKMPSFFGKQIQFQKGSEQYDKLMAGAEAAWNASPEGQAAMRGPEIDAGQYEIDPELTRSFTNEDFVKDPGYDFRMKEGQKALERSAAARGGLQSGGFMKGLSRYGQDYASGEYQNAYNRFNNDRSNRFNRLSSLAGGGQTANNQIGAAGQNYANQVGQNSMGAANAQGAAGIAGANAWGSSLSGIGKGVNDYVAQNEQNKWMDKWMSSQGKGG